MKSTRPKFWSRHVMDVWFVFSLSALSGASDCYEYCGRAVSNAEAIGSCCHHFVDTCYCLSGQANASPTKQQPASQHTNWTPRSASLTRNWSHHFPLCLLEPPNTAQPSFFRQRYRGATGCWTLLPIRHQHFEVRAPPSFFYRLTMLQE